MEVYGHFAITELSYIRRRWTTRDTKPADATCIPLRGGCSRGADRRAEPSSRPWCPPPAQTPRAGFRQASLTSPSSTSSLRPKRGWPLPPPLGRIPPVVLHPPAE